MYDCVWVYEYNNIQHSLPAARGLLHRLHECSDEFQNDRWCENINNATNERDNIINNALGKLRFFSRIIYVMLIIKVT